MIIILSFLLILQSSIDNLFCFKHEFFEMSQISSEFAKMLALDYADIFGEQYCTDTAMCIPVYRN